MAGTSGLTGRGQKEDQPADDAVQLVRNAENLKAVMYGVKGESSINVSMIDQDYQMIDSHIDEAMCKKIVSFEFIDFGRLIANNRGFRDKEGQ